MEIERSRGLEQECTAECERACQRDLAVQLRAILYQVVFDSSIHAAD